jgi:hypothetical protein
VKWTVKLVLCFLIAWLPFAGYAAQAPFCQDAPFVTASGPVAAAHTRTTMMHRDDMAAMSSHHHSAACHGGSINAQCGDIAALPAGLSVLAPAYITVSYALRDHRLLPQFIPDLPQRPPSFV